MESLSLKALQSFSGVGTVAPWQRSTALLLVDMQGSCARPEGYTIRRLRERHLEEAVRQYQRQLAIVIPNLRRLLDRARERELTIIHTQVLSLSGRGPGGQERVKRQVAPDSAEGAIIEELYPRPNEFVLAKACSGVFAGTNLNYLLRRLGIQSLIVGGVVTNGCVEHAITHGHDLGYSPVLVSDGTAALTDEIHYNALERLAHRRAHVMSTSELLNIEQIPATTET